MAYYSSDQDKLTRENLIRDPEFLNDLFGFLKGRTGKTYDSADEAFDEYVELMRKAYVNEVTALKNLTYARKADEAAKAQLGRLYITFDRLEKPTGFLQLLGDYAEGLFTAPSTVASFLLPAAGIAGKSAAFGTAMTAARVAAEAAKKPFVGTVAREAAKAARKLTTAGISESVKRGTYRGILMEGGIGGMQGFLESSARKEAGLESGVITRTAIGAGLGAITAGVFGRQVAKARGRQEEAVLGVRADLEELGVKRAESAIKERQKQLKLLRAKLRLDGKTKLTNKQQKELTEWANAAETDMQALKKADTVEAEQLRRELLASGAIGKDTGALPLDQYGVEASRTAGKLFNPSTWLDTRSMDPSISIHISNELYDNMTAVGRELVELFQKNNISLKNPVTKQYLRVSELVTTAMDKDLLGKEAFSKMFELGEKFNLTNKQLAKLMIMDAHEAGKTLNKWSQVTKSITAGDKAVLERILAARKDIADIPAKVANEEELSGLSKRAIEARELYENLNRFRLGLMTIQPATTLRNVLNGIARLGVYALDNLAYGILTLNPATMAKGWNAARGLVWNPSEARLFSDLLAIESPKVQKMFMANMDVEAAFGKGTRLANFSRSLNFFNTTADNLFKRSIFFAEAISSVGGYKNFSKLLRGHQLFNPVRGGMGAQDISDGMLEALSFTFQKGPAPEDKLSRWFISAFSKPVPSILIPFPRFIVNMLEFVTEHAPFLPILAAKNRRSMKAFKQSLAKQVVGTGMLYGALQLRAQQGPTARWWELYNQETDQFQNAQAIYGPYAPFMLSADIILKATLFNGAEGSDLVLSDETRKRWENIAKDSIASSLKSDTFFEFLKATFGTTFRTGAGYEIVRGLRSDIGAILEQGADAPDIKKQGLAARAGVTFATNYINTFMVPMGLVRDIMGQLDPEFQLIRDTDDFDTGAMFWKKALRTLPVKAIEDPTDPEAGAYFGWIQGPQGLARKAMSPASYEELRREEGVIKQLTGLSNPRIRNEVQKELIRLNIPEWRVYPKLKGDPDLNRLAKTYYQLYTEKIVAPLVANPEYQAMPPRERTQRLRASLSGLRTKVIDAMLATFMQDLRRTPDSDKKDEIEDKLLRLNRLRWNLIPQTQRALALEQVPDLPLNTWTDYMNAISVVKRFRRIGRTL